MTSGSAPGNEGSADDYTYDAWNRLVEVTSGGGTNTLAVYVFDGTGRRIIEKSYSGGTLNETRYVYYSAQWQRLEIRVGGTSSSNLNKKRDITD